MDMKTAFLYSLINGEVYVRQSRWFYNGICQVCKFNRIPYNLEQSSKVWYNTLVAFVKAYRLHILNTDLGVYVKPEVIIGIDVDDLLITGSFSTEIEALKQAFNKRFYMLDLRPSKHYFGITITCNKKNQPLRPGQRTYLKRISHNHKMTDCNTSLTSYRNSTSRSCSSGFSTYI